MDPWCPNCRQPWPTDEQEALRKTAEEYFTAYFANNYHGTVVFHDPAWHAPRVFRAALWALQQAKKDAERTAQETVPVPGDAWRTKPCICHDDFPASNKDCEAHPPKETVI